MGAAEGHTRGSWGSGFPANGAAISPTGKSVLLITEDFLGSFRTGELRIGPDGGKRAATGCARRPVFEGGLEPLIPDNREPPEAQ